jgi:lipopolysaccharide export system permease protein
VGDNMKKLDKLVFKSFIGPFFLTFCVVVFIFLLQFLLRHFEDIVGKGLGWSVYAQLLGYFSINMTPVSFPLAVLLSSLMTYGNLGEHSELTALKGAGISLTRTLVPMFFFSILLTITAFLSNNYIVPKANLKAYSLLYDIKHKSPALNIKEGVFYNNIPGYQIKVNKKFSDGRSLKDVIIYNHSKRTGNTEVTLADSGQMYTIRNDRYLVMELFNGNHYSEQELKPAKRSISDRHKPSPYARNKFEHSKFVFSMASFDLKRTKEELFAGNRLMKDVEKLKKDVDSLEKDIKYAKYEAFINLKAKFNYHLDDLEEPEELNPENYGRLSKPDSLRRSPELRRIQNSKKTTSFAKSVNVDQPKDSSAFTKPKDSDKNKTSSSPSSKAKLYSRAAGDVPEPRSKRLLQTKKLNKPKNTFSVLKDGPDSLLNGDFSNTRYMVSAVTNARFVKNHVMVTTSKLSVKKVELLRFKIQRYKIYAQAFSCLIMFLIGAPLGSIIKRGGFGFPVIVSIGFFIVYYVFMSIGEKWAKEELVTPFFGVWLANFVLLPFGLFFLRQARLDARVFESDFYSVIIDQLKSKILDKFKNPKRFVLFNR